MYNRSVKREKSLADTVFGNVILKQEFQFESAVVITGQKLGEHSLKINNVQKMKMTPENQGG